MKDTAPVRSVLQVLDSGPGTCRSLVPLALGAGLEVLASGETGVFLGRKAFVLVLGEAAAIGRLEHTMQDLYGSGSTVRRDLGEGEATPPPEAVPDGTHPQSPDRIRRVLGEGDGPTNEATLDAERNGAGEAVPGD